MGDDEIEIPNDIDERLYIVFEKEEFGAILLGVFIGGQILGLLGALVGPFIAYRGVARFKARQPRGVIRHWLYWVGIMNFRNKKWGNGLQREVIGR